MLHIRNISNYSVQPDGCGQGRGKTKSRSAKSSSRKTHLDDARVSPHSPRSVPADFNMNSESELIHGNISRSEPFSGGNNRNISMPVQKLVQSSQRRRVGNMPKPLAGAHELLLTHQELSWSREDHRTLGRLEERVVIDSSFGDRGPSGVYKLQKCPRISPRDLRRGREVPRPNKAREKAKPIGTDLTHEGTGSPNWSLQPWTVYTT
ncbi:hypothetical protein O181_124646 [Austropuccinia psidii MF-1]|uniref:Uncharacterized protein n=1 Tax=Austropuccinia psidii MF-1 TaxID=1389203 RepID=A0A9Q3Q4C1_9BASI|nr:hypothetical protein [Austropuccinia psidii MF-1]